MKTMRLVAAFTLLILNLYTSHGKILNNQIQISEVKSKSFSAWTTLKPVADQLKSEYPSNYINHFDIGHFKAHFV